MSAPIRPGESPSEESPEPGAAAEAGAPRGMLERRWSWALAAASLGAIAFAYRELLLLRPRTSISVSLAAGAENWFFEPSDTSPGLVLVLIAWLLYRRRERLRRTLGNPGSLALTLGLVVSGLLVFYWALRTDAHEVQAIALLLEGLGLAHAFGGRSALRVVAVPAALIVFAMPLPSPLLNQLVWSFQIWTANFAGLFFDVIGQPALVSGDRIVLPDQLFQVIETCSGLRTVETLTLLAVLMLDLFGRRGVHALILLVVAPFIAFLTNGLRVVGLMFNPSSDVASVHNLQGIAMLLGGVLVLYAIDGVLQKLLPQRPAPLPEPLRSRRAAQTDRRRAWGLVVGVAALSLGLSLWLPRWELDPVRAERPADHVPLEIGGWRGTEVATDRMFLGQAGFSHILHRDYVRGRQRVDVFIATATLSRRHRSFLTPKTLIPGSGWIVEEHTRRQTADGRSVDVLLTRRGARRLLTHHWRQDSLGLGREILRTALALDDSALRRTRIPIVVRLSTAISSDPAGQADAEARLLAFADHLKGEQLEDLGAPRGIER